MTIAGSALPVNWHSSQILGDFLMHDNEVPDFGHFFLNILLIFCEFFVNTDKKNPGRPFLFSQSPGARPVPGVISF